MRSVGSVGRGVRVGWILRIVLVVLAVLHASSEAHAEVRRTGAWPDEERRVSIEVAGVSRSQAVKELAEKAGWSVVLYAAPTDAVDLKVNGQPADKVLELLLADGVYEASRTGDLIAIKRLDAPAAAPAAPPPPAPPPAPAPPAPPEAPRARGSDRVVSGQSLRIEKNEVVHDVSVLGGSLEVFGTVTGDVAVMGGSARIHDGARVMGDASAVGGSLTIDDGARIDGDVGAIGGAVRRGEKAVVGGEVAEVGGGHGPAREAEPDEDHASDAHEGGKLARLGRDAASAVNRTALLFVFGTVLLALGARRMEQLKVEVAARPMRSFALGIVGSIAALVVVVLLCVTIIGIPFAALGVLLALFGVVAGICAVLETVGGALAGHRTQSPYAHLALGCVLFLVAGAIPVVGGFVKAAVILIGIGTLVATRGAGFFARKNGKSGPHPYREPMSS